MKIAVCIKGLFDFSLESFANVRENVFKALEEEHHELKFFIISQLSDLNENFSMLAIAEKIKPEKIWLSQDRTAQRNTAMHNVVPYQLLDCCKIVKDYQQENEYEFDATLIIRMDVLFNKKLTEENIDYRKVNVECIFVPDMNSGDNIIWIPKTYFDSVYTAFSRMIEDRNNSHQAWKYFEGENVPVHYIGGATGKRQHNYDVVIRFTRYCV